MSAPEIVSKNVDASGKQTEFALAAFTEMPSQQKATSDLHILSCISTNPKTSPSIDLSYDGNQSSGRHDESDGVCSQPWINVVWKAIHSEYKHHRILIGYQENLTSIIVSLISFKGLPSKKATTHFTEKKQGTISSSLSVYADKL
ncbi:hypothetical protein Nepgr_029506 [Nepenthes gracilis]|uniref:Uncharacterized protein n=1 Tax=Nepenthes gracilis TaxID=150966 RepID=A0AAD3TCK6_NEPGR|nr:hypothetical protein Nepgr_029506 [Nepenthes gracilis]